MGGEALAAPFPLNEAGDKNISVSEGPSDTVYSDFVVDKGLFRFMWWGPTDFLDNPGSLLMGDILVSL